MAFLGCLVQAVLHGAVLGIVPEFSYSLLSVCLRNQNDHYYSFRNIPREAHLYTAGYYNGKPNVRVCLHIHTHSF